MEESFITVKTFTFPADVTIVQTFMEMRHAKEALIEGGFAQPEDFQFL